MTERKNLTQPTDWWAAFEAAAQKKKLTLSEWVGRCCVAKLPPEQKRKLTDRPKPGRPKE